MGNECSVSSASLRARKAFDDVCHPQICGRFNANSCAFEPRARVQQRDVPKKIDWSEAGGPEHWSYPESAFDGSYSHSKGKDPELKEVKGAIKDGLEILKKSKEKYEGVFYQTDMTSWPADQQVYTLVKRTGCGFKVKAGTGPFTYIESQFAALSKDVTIKPDKHTTSVLSAYIGQKLGTPVCPGRGHGIGDVPNLKIIGDADPGDISQGQVGDCWFLSAVSSLAEFDGAIHKLFRKNDHRNMPKNEWNFYTVTLYDLETLKEVDIEVDEQLCTDHSGSLLGAKPSLDGELWVCYLEKAFAALCGGWDKIKGGNSDHAWRILTGCTKVYTLVRGQDGWGCYRSGTKDAKTGKWDPLKNSPKDNSSTLSPIDWPDVGGGGSMRERLDDKDLFQRLFEWDEHNFMLAAGTKSGSDTHTTDGIVDGHAYAMLQAVANVADSGINMVQMRNPWGHEEFKSGAWTDDGHGWDKHPEIKQQLKPAVADDGIFWMDQREFFAHFKTFYLCAMDMTEFIS